MTKDSRLGCLSSNQLKIIALVAMTLDHIGKQLLPQYSILQIIGRIAFPIFAYMIAEGCLYTRSRKRYFATIFLTGVICQIGYFIAMKSLYMCVLITFSLSILIIYSIDFAIKPIRDYIEGVENNVSLRLILICIARITIPITLILMVLYACEVLPDVLWRRHFNIDYGIWGVLMPVFIYYGKGKLSKLILALIAMVLLSLSIEGIQWYSLASLIPLVMYSGKRGRFKMKNLFYIYYPLHLVAIYGIYLLIR